MADAPYNPWGGPGVDVKQQSSLKRAIDSGDVGLGGLQTVFGKAPPTVGSGVANLGQMGSISADQALRAGYGGQFRDPATGQQYDGLSNTDMDQYLASSAGMIPGVGQQFSPADAYGTARTADALGTAAVSRAYNPLEYAANPTSDVAGMLAQRDYLRQVANGAPTAAQGQLTQGLNDARAGQASIAAGVRGSQAAAARRASMESQLDITNQGRGQMATQQAADRMSAQGQLQDMNQGITQALTQRQGLMAQGNAADADAMIKNQQAMQDALRSQLANLASRNDLTAAQKQQMLQAWQNRVQMDRIRAAYGLRGVQMTANRDLGYVGTDTGNAQAAGGVTDRVNMARFEDATQRGAATTAAIGAGAGMAIRGLSGGSTSPSTSSPSGNYAGADASASPYAGYA